MLVVTLLGQYKFFSAFAEKNTLLMSVLNDSIQNTQPFNRKNVQKYD